MAALNCSGAMLGGLPIRVSPSKTPVRDDHKEGEELLIVRDDPTDSGDASTGHHSGSDDSGSTNGSGSSGQVNVALNGGSSSSNSSMLAGSSV